MVLLFKTNISQTSLPAQTPKTLGNIGFTKQNHKFQSEILVLLSKTICFVQNSKKHANSNKTNKTIGLRSLSRLHPKPPSPDSWNLCFYWFYWFYWFFWGFLLFSTKHMVLFIKTTISYWNLWFCLVKPIFPIETDGFA